MTHSVGHLTFVKHICEQLQRTHCAWLLPDNETGTDTVFFNTGCTNVFLTLVYWLSVHLLIIIILLRFKVAYGIRHKYNLADRRGEWFYRLPNRHLVLANF